MRQDVLEVDDDEVDELYIVNDLYYEIRIVLILLFDDDELAVDFDEIDEGILVFEK